MLLEQLFILVYMHLSDEYQQYWLSRKPCRPRRLVELIRAIAVGMESLFMRNHFLDDTGGKVPTNPQDAFAQADRAAAERLREHFRAQY
jgi:hypothetical protein